MSHKVRYYMVPRHTRIDPFRGAGASGNRGLGQGNKHDQACRTAGYRESQEALLGTAIIVERKKTPSENWSIQKDS